MTAVRGIRGAIKVDQNEPEQILEACKTLLLKMIEENDIATEDIVSVFLTTTDDLNAEFPAYAARDLGWSEVPLLCAQEMKVPHGMKMLLRVLIHVNTSLPQNKIKHKYLGEAKKLRPDLCQGDIDDSNNAK